MREGEGQFFDRSSITTTAKFWFATVMPILRTPSISISWPLKGTQPSGFTQTVPVLWTVPGAPT